MNAPTIGALLLGAGFSRRFGAADKRLASFGGQTVAEATLDLYCHAFSNCRLVLRSDDTQLAERLHRYPIEIVDTAEAAAGMSRSLAAGVANLDWDWTFVALLDMPFVRPDSLEQLQQAARDAVDKTIIRPQAAGRPDLPGHPVGFHRSLLPELAASEGDQGARAVLAAHSESVLIVSLDDEGLYRDIDTPEDLR